MLDSFKRDAVVHFSAHILFPASGELAVCSMHFECSAISFLSRLSSALNFILTRLLERFAAIDRVVM